MSRLTGLGYSLIPSFEARGPRTRGVLALPLTPPAGSGLEQSPVEYPVHALWRKDTPENPLLDALLEAAPRAQKGPETGSTHNL
jgi:DNA-binding transcriptional LysR family regulator